MLLIYSLSSKEIFDGIYFRALIKVLNSHFIRHFMYIYNNSDRKERLILDLDIS
jgi:hypothetical protein